MANQQNIRFPYLLRTWRQVLLIGALLAIGISLWPSASCALAGTCQGERDLWCSPSEPQCCGPTNGLGVLVGCSRGANGYCIEDFIADAWGVRCTNLKNCKVTECVSKPPGYGCFLSGEGVWDVGRCSAFPTCSRQERNIAVTCCEKPAAPTPCPSTPPTLGSGPLHSEPPHPLVYGQDPTREGVFLSNLIAEAGQHDCRSGTIAALEVSIELNKASIDQITTTLARRYPGARVLGTYPIIPGLEINGLDTAYASAVFHFIPLDPGTYDVRVTAIQDDGQVATRTYSLPVTLYESTINR
jgi:hypothetical protein